MSKSIKNCFDKKLTLNNLFNAYLRSVKNKGNNKNSLLFSYNLENNLINIYNELKNNNYNVGKYNAFKIYEPKERLIKSLPFKDRIVQQWYVKEFINPFFLSRFIYDSYACIESKGNHKAVLRVQEYMRKMRIIYGEYYVIKCDIKKFFYNIDRNVLFFIMKENISDKKLHNLTYKFIYEDNSFKGLAIGNYIFQYFANIYLNKLDYFIKYNLNIKYYVRFMDDFIILVDTKDKAKFIFNKIGEFLNSYLKLELNKKSCYYKNKFGIDFCGYVIFENYILIRKLIKNNIKRCFKRWNKLLNNNNLDINKVNKSIKSYLSCLSHCNSYNYINKYIKINYNRLIFMIKKQPYSSEKCEKYIKCRSEKCEK